MFAAMKVYVRIVDTINRILGRIVMYLVFAMMGVLLYSAITKAVDVPPLWAVEMAQFLMVGYFLLGGGYSMQLDGHVRMDLLYGMWSPRTRAIVDVVTSFFLIFYLALLIYGGISSTTYAIEYGQKNYSAWAPYLWPVKSIMTIGIVLMTLQAIATLFRDLATASGRPLDE